MQKELSTSVIAPKGARWVPELVKRNSGDVEIPCLMLVFDLGTADENVQNALSHYGAVTMSHFINGTSFRVIQQGMWRNSESASVDAICKRIVDFRSGQRSARTVAIRTVEKFIGPNDESYSTKEEAAAAWAEHYSK